MEVKTTTPKKQLRNGFLQFNTYLFVTNVVYPVILIVFLISYIE